MTKEDKELLLKDLSARLPYGVKISNGYGIIKISTGVFLRNTKSINNAVAIQTK